MVLQHTVRLNFSKYHSIKFCHTRKRGQGRHIAAQCWVPTPPYKDGGQEVCLGLPIISEYWGGGSIGGRSSEETTKSLEETGKMFCSSGETIKLFSKSQETLKIL